MTPDEKDELLTDVAVARGTLVTLKNRIREGDAPRAIAAAQDIRGEMMDIIVTLRQAEAAGGRVMGKGVLKSLTAEEVATMAHATIQAKDREIERLRSRAKHSKS